MAWTKKSVYDHGLPFSECLGKSLDEQTSRVNSNKASLIIVDGGVGQGKTTLSVLIADYIQKGKINLKDQLGLGGKDFITKLFAAVDKGYKVVIYDEAGDFDRKGAISRFNRMLNRVFDTYRTFKIIIILVLPSFKVLEDSLFDKKIPRLLINTHNRKERYGCFRSYSLYRMYLVKNLLKSLKVPPQAYNLIVPNYRGNFLDLDEQRSKELDKISTESKKEVLKEYNLISDGLLDREDVARLMNKSVDWVVLKVRELKIKPDSVHKKKHYYKEDILQLLEKEVQR